MSFFKKLFNAKSVPGPMQPEEYYQTEITDDYVQVSHPGRPAEKIRWEDIVSIKLVNTDEGPFQPDVWMLLIGDGHGCSIPQGSKGWNDVYNIVSKWSGFNFENVMRSATCTGNEIFVLWTK